jgi:protein FAM50
MAIRTSFARDDARRRAQLPGPVEELLQAQFIRLQASVKATEIGIPFVFYDGTNIRGGMCGVKKGDHVWFFLDKVRKVGAERGV